MWIVINDAFLSVVSIPTDPDNLMVRARAKKDINNVFGPDVKVLTTPDADYRFRAVLPRTDVGLKIADRIMEIDYTNFKNSVPEKDRHDAYLRMWCAMDEFQTQRHGRRKFIYNPPPSAADDVATMSDEEWSAWLDRRYGKKKGPARAR